MKENLINIVAIALLVSTNLSYSGSLADEADARDAAEAKSANREKNETLKISKIEKLISTQAYIINCQAHNRNGGLVPFNVAFIKGYAFNAWGANWENYGGEGHYETYHKNRNIIKWTESGGDVKNEYHIDKKMLYQKVNIEDSRGVEKMDCVVAQDGKSY